MKQKTAIEDQLKIALKDERMAELALVKEKIKLFGFKTTDFKGVLKTRKKSATPTATADSTAATEKKKSSR